MKARSLFLTSLAVGFSGAMMPGPLLALDIRESVRLGFVAGPLLILGHAALELALVIAILLGFGRLLARDKVKGGISLAGGGVLLWMAWGMLRDASTLAPPGAAPAAAPGLPPVPAGALISLSNPYWSVWWASIGLAYLTRAREVPRYGAGLFFTGHILADFLWYSAVSAAVASGRSLLSTGLYRGLIAVCGLFLVYVALWFAD
ncbi:MAG: LysE family transporter, partial [Bacteroidota bacterium]